MGQIVCNGALMKCSFGAAPGSLIVTPDKKVLTQKMPAATIMDNVPNKNIPPFGVCSSMANPQVASATAAAQGVLTPQPCVPVTTAPWVTGSPTVLVGKIPALNKTSTLLCTWGGVITINVPGQTTVNVP